MGRVLARGEKVLLRDPVPSDAGAYVHWMSHGEWRSFDAPWENEGGPITDAKAAELTQRFLAMCGEKPPHPRVRPFITTRDNLPIGWVSRYGEERFPGAWLVGIDICDDRYLNGGLGTEALELWIDYLFGNSDVHRLGLDTWSFNTRMAHVARRLGFVFEGAQREVVKWQGKWLDRLHFGMLRSEWDARAGTMPLIAKRSAPADAMNVGPVSRSALTQPGS